MNDKFVAAHTAHADGFGAINIIIKRANHINCQLVRAPKDMAIKHTAEGILMPCRAVLDLSMAKGGVKDQRFKFS